MKLKQSTLYRATIFVLATTLVLCAGVIVSQGVENHRLREQRDCAVKSVTDCRNLLEDTQRLLARQRNHDSGLDAQLNDAARDLMTGPRYDPYDKPEYVLKSQPNAWLIMPDGHLEPAVDMHPGH